MTRLKMIGLCLAAVLVASASVAAIASAETLPALYECAKVKVKGSGIWNKGCKVEGKHNKTLKENEYEIQEGWGKGKVFKGKSVKGTLISLTIPKFATVTCSSFTDEGKFTGEKTGAGIKATFKGCEVEKYKCNSAGARAGEIKTNPLKGVVGYTNAVKHEVGIKLSAETGTVLAQFSCPEPNNIIWLRVTGSVIGQAAPVNVFTKVAKVKFVEEFNKQVPESFEGGLEEDFLNTQDAVSETEPNWEIVGGSHSTQTAEAENKGEELMLKA